MQVEAACSSADNPDYVAGTEAASFDAAEDEN